MKWFVFGLAGLLAWGTCEDVMAQGPPQADRVEAIAAMMTPAPHGVGRPIDDREAWDALARTHEAGRIIKQAEGYVGRPMPELTDDLLLEYSRNGNRTRCQDVMSARHGRLRPLVVAECLENQGRFLPEIEKTLSAICDEKSWVLPAHDRNLTNFKGTLITVDLRSSAVGWQLATARYLLADRLSPAMRERVRHELSRRVFVPYERMVHEGKPGMWWLTGRSNWNAVCIANVTGAALASLESAERRAFYAAAAEKYIQYFLDGFTDDGYCSEGLGYWNYGFGHFVKLAETVVQATGGRVDLMADPRVRQIARFGRRMEITPGIYPAFADCDPDEKPAPWIEGYVSRRFGFGWPEGRRATLSLNVSSDLTLAGLFCFANSLADRDNGPAQLPAQPPRDWFDKAGVLVCRPSPGAKRPFGAAMKGGHNAEQHNHNDVGSFVVALGDRAPLLDPGAEVYTGRTFGKNRYQSGVLGSWGHPVPRVAGRSQQTGRKAAARVLETSFSDETDTLTLDLHAAYDVESLNALTRSFVFSRRDGGSLVVTDRVTFADHRPETFGTALVTFDPWERTGANTLRVGKGDWAVDVTIDTDGAPFEIHAETIQEDLRCKQMPTRLGIDLAEPVERAAITLTIRPAA